MRRASYGGGGELWRMDRTVSSCIKENRVTDHRIGFTAYNLDKVLAGELDDLVSALLQDERQKQLERG